MYARLRGGRHTKDSGVPDGVQDAIKQVLPDAMKEARQVRLFRLIDRDCMLTCAQESDRPTLYDFDDN